MTAAEYYIQQGEERGEARGTIAGKREVAVNALKQGFAVETIIN